MGHAHSAGSWWDGAALAGCQQILIPRRASLDHHWTFETDKGVGDLAGDDFTLGEFVSPRVRTSILASSLTGYRQLRGRSNPESLASASVRRGYHTYLFPGWRDVGHFGTGPCKPRWMRYGSG